MLSVAKLASEQARYYLDDAAERVDVADSLGSGAEDYYVDPGEARGRWGGVGAERLRLAGDVEAEQLRRLLGGLHPVSGGSLRDDGRTVKVAAYDATFSAPKSVSVLFGVGDTAMEGVIRQAHDTAVNEAVAYLERHGAAVRRGAAGAQVHEVDGLVIAQFRHRSSRAGDPQLHTHAVIANGAYGPDGRWSALDGRRIFAQAPTASRVYQAVLRGELTRTLGLRWTATRDGIAEVDGVPLEVRRAFSKRRQEIEASLTERGTSGNRAAEAAALATRRSKDRSVKGHELRITWRHRAADVDFSADAARALVGLAQPARPADFDDAIRRLIDQADVLTARSSTFCRREVIVALCDLLPGGTPVTGRALERAADEVLASRELVALTDDGDKETFRMRDGRTLRVGADDRRYTTASLLALEQQILTAAVEGQNAGRAVVAAPTASALSDEQRAMVHALNTRGDAIAVVAGRAGTGKTFALAAAHEAWREANVPVWGVAVARRAAQELERGSGIPSTSVTAMLQRLDRGSPLPPGAVLVVDEAGMLGTRDLARLLGHVETATGKLVLVGDNQQLPEIDAGGVLRGLVRRGLAVELTENRRQTHAWERTAVEQLRNGDVRHALDAYRLHNRIHTSSTGDETREALVDDWLADRHDGDAVMIAARRADVESLNAIARRRLAQTGELGDEELRLGRLQYVRGDRVVIRRNDSQLGVANGDRAVVTAVNPNRCALTVRTDRGDVVLDARFLVGRSRTGDPALVHGYAMTCHVAQGATVDRAYVLTDAGLCREWGYTALTRGRHENHLYVSRAPTRDRDEFAPRGRFDEPVDPLERLAAALERSDAQPLALDSRRDERRRSRGLER